MRPSALWSRWLSRSATHRCWRTAGGKGSRHVPPRSCSPGSSTSSSLTGNSDANQPNPTLLDYFWSQVKGAGGGLLAAGRDLADPSRLRRQYEADRSATRNDNPIAVAAVAGTVDVYPHRQDALFAYGLNYAPRPATQSLIATAPSLARLDAAFLLSPAAPQSILFDIQAVDNNYPSILDGLSWPNLLTQYDIVDTSGAFGTKTSQNAACVSIDASHDPGRAFRRIHRPSQARRRSALGEISFETPHGRPDHRRHLQAARPWDDGRTSVMPAAKSRCRFDFCRRWRRKGFCFRRW